VGEGWRRGQRDSGVHGKPARCRGGRRSAVVVPLGALLETAVHGHGVSTFRMGGAMSARLNAVPGKTSGHVAGLPCSLPHRGDRACGGVCGLLPALPRLSLSSERASSSA
jgi:hypothetical protein